MRFDDTKPSSSKEEAHHQKVSLSLSSSSPNKTEEEEEDHKEETKRTIQRSFFLSVLFLCIAEEKVRRLASFDVW